jgi:hypothetical protein
MNTGLSLSLFVFENDAEHLDDVRKDVDDESFRDV